jgi:hypothetical protein
MLFPSSHPHLAPCEVLGSRKAGRARFLGDLPTNIDHSNNVGKTMGKPWENDILTILTYKYQQKWRLYGISNSFMIAKLVHITPTTMVYDRQITL